MADVKPCVVIHGNRVVVHEVPEGGLHLHLHLSGRRVDVDGVEVLRSAVERACDGAGPPGAHQSSAVRAEFDALRGRFNGPRQRDAAFFADLQALMDVCSRLIQIEGSPRGEFRA